jgi:hypothetical protein
MAKANKIGLVGYAVLQHLQNGLCSHCAQPLAQAFNFPMPHGSIRIENIEDYKTSIAHILAESKGGKNTLANYTLQHYLCNRAFYNHDYAEFAEKSGSVKSYAEVKATARQACELNKAIISGKLSIAEVKQHAAKALVEAGGREFIRRYPNQVSVLGLEAM